MMDDTNKNQLIEQYLHDELSGEQLREFQERLSTDAHFRKEVALERAILKNLRAVGRQQEKLKLESFHQEMVEVSDHTLQVEAKDEPKAGKQVRFIPKQYLIAAASIVLIIAATLIFITLPGSRADSDTLFAAQFRPYPSMQIQRGTSVVNLSSSAFVAYNKGDYSVSIELFNKVLEIGKDESILFYLGNAYLAANKPKEAILTFENYLKEYQEFRIEAKWYLGLSYLKNKQEQQAKQQFEELIKSIPPTNAYSIKAQEILKQLP
jgi:tetratricopeptide (TPR) repeat protein